MADNFRFDPIDHSYWLGATKLVSVTQVLDSHGLISSFAKDGNAAFRGSMAHLACRYLLEQRLDWSTVSDAIMGYVISLDRWLEHSGFEPKHCEVSSYHPELLFAGTDDVEGIHPKLGDCLFDLKTSVSCARWHEIQTGGYVVLKQRPFARGCLHLRKDGKAAKFHPHDKETDPRDFVSCLNTYRLKEECAK